jgi:hypothetical protein
MTLPAFRRRDQLRHVVAGRRKARLVANAQGVQVTVV